MTPCIKVAPAVGVAVDVFKPGHGNASLAPIFTEHAVVVNKRLVCLPSTLKRHLDWLAVLRSLAHACTHILKQRLVVTRKGADDVLTGQPLERLVLADNRLLREVQRLHAFGTHSGHVNQVVVLHLQQVNHKQVVGNQLNVLLRFFALFVFLGTRAVHAAMLAVAETARRYRTHNARC